MKFLKLSLVTALMLVLSTMAFAGNWDMARGVISTIDYEGSSFTLATDDEIVTVLATEDTRIMIGHEAAEFADLEEGMTVVVRGTYDEDGNLVASMIKVHSQLFCDVTSGTITSIDYDAMTLVLFTDDETEVFVQATDDTRIKGNCEILTFADLAVDMQVAVAGTMEDDVLNARMIKVYGEGCEEE